MTDNFKDIASLLFKPESLKELFERKLIELDLNQTSVLNILGIQSRALTKILDGTQKLIDPTVLVKLAHFLQLPNEKVFKLYLDAVERNFPVETAPPEKIKFIRENFDLAVLKKAGFINSLTDFNHIEQRLLARLGLRSIFEYRKPPIDIAFSSGYFKQESSLTRGFWIKAAMACFEEIDNPNDYDREKLITLFPQLRWYTMNEERGISEVIRLLYRVGVTVIYQPPLQTLQLRGATFSVNDKPCIVLTNYVGFYATLWWGLIHELYHVLFDWDEILTNKYHLTDDSNEQLSVQERESMADNFAREYLFSNEKLKTLRPFIQDASYVGDVAKDNHVHPSIIYAFNAFDTGKNDRKAWARARRHSPDIKEVIKKIDLPWEDAHRVEEIFEVRKSLIYI